MSWNQMASSMVSRMKSLRTLLASRLTARLPGHDFGWITRQRGMFSLLGLPEAKIARLRDEHHIYMPPDGRMNVAGISEANVDYVADAVAGLLACGVAIARIARGEAESIVGSAPGRLASACVMFRRSQSTTACGATPCR